MPISANQPAPDFALADQTGAVRKLSEFRGQPVVLYFYPKDDTPGCATSPKIWRGWEPKSTLSPP